MPSVDFNQEELEELLHGLDSIDGGCTNDTTYKAENKIRHALYPLTGSPWHRPWEEK